MRTSAGRGGSVGWRSWVARNLRFRWRLREGHPVRGLGEVQLALSAVEPNSPPGFAVSCSWPAHDDLVHRPAAVDKYRGWEDLTMTTKRSSKGPKKSASQLVVRLDPESKAYLTQAADLRRISVSDYVRVVAVTQAQREVLAAREQT